MFVEGDFEGFYIVRQCNNGTSDTDACMEEAGNGGVYASVGEESDCFRLVPIESKPIVSEPRVQCSEAKLEMTETGLESAVMAGK